ncbi:glycosyltransferase [Tessaracoccus rhinocerotis]|uniref:4,4'-diaponeurosporenoate glycosyltransferase n=1 Tax=Tessaracoccus rhinocerotis TaxID=1689449 RepID=A0A553K1P7_9ACTN|nr:glycosyltransferase [Tessaracoccus rhinocerotis]TRY18626.1 glycosyltransferase [Tessaracoccus rhinocerotis]
MVSVIIAAHNEAAVLGRTLDTLLADAPGAQVIVVANGCSDDTSGVARSRSGVDVIRVSPGSKPLALNTGDIAADSFPRIFLDADISVPKGTVDRLVTALETPGIMAAGPSRKLNVSGRPWPVASHAAIHSRLPAFRQGLFGRGMIAISEEGRARFEEFPNMVADDLFLDSLFAPHEKILVEESRVVVEAPATTKDLVRRLVRVRRGSTAMRRAGRQGLLPIRPRPSDAWSWIRDVVAKDAKLLPAGVVYAALTAYSGILASHGPVDSMDWGRGESARP